MTASTEQERADFEREMAAIFTNTDFEVAPEGHYENPITGTWLLIWQSARRAPAAQVPKPDALRNAAQSALDLLEYVKKAPSDAGFIDWRAAEVEKELRAALSGDAAAPQPPEADHIPDAGKMVAAPDQLPEPAAEVQSKIGTTCMFSSTTMRKGDKIYTEQQVRQLLAGSSVTRKSA